MVSSRDLREGNVRENSYDLLRNICWQLTFGVKSLFRRIMKIKRKRLKNKFSRYSACGEQLARNTMHPPLTIHRHPMCAEIIEEFQKCHIDHPLGKFFGQCTDLKIKLDRCFCQEKALKRRANFEESKKLKERLRVYRRETAETGGEKNVAQA